MNGELSWMIGGPQGSGVDSAASMMGRACAAGGLWVFGKREYHSNIMGLHSYFQFRASPVEVRSHLDPVDLLVAFEEETLFRHADSVVPNGSILYDPAKVEKPLSEVRTFHGIQAGAVRRRLEGAGLPTTTGGVLKEAEGRGVLLHPLPYGDILAQFRRDHPEVSPSKLVRATNTMAVAASLALVRFDLAPLERGILHVFAAKKEVGELNVRVARATYEYVKDHVTPSRIPPLRTGAAAGRLFLTGTQAVAIGKILGGCRFQTYYPITPASDESEWLESHEVFPLSAQAGSDQHQGGIVVVQTEDEISAITMATGAGLAGARAATSTSGPGFSLMAEGLGFAGINEVPMVVTLYQRAGPSTGLPTRHEQGDLRFALHAGHGEFPRIVLASGDAEECIYDAARCLNYAERFQTPVIHLVDKALANSNSLVPPPSQSLIHIDRGKLLESPPANTGPPTYLRFDPSAEDGVSPRVALGQEGFPPFWHTGDEHDPHGHIDEDPENRRLMMEKREAKMRAAAREIPTEEKVAWHGPKEPETVVVSWGSTKGAILDALAALERKGRSLGFLQVRLLDPFPSAEVKELLKRAKRRIVIETNFSAQLAGLVAEKTQIVMDHHLVKFNGRPLSQNEVEEALETALGPEAPARIVMTHGR
ncbi:MAG: 2-oxoacid:acceptor oxidoreductase subunit alpha [Euryarchaeota archaeon]|nr:2-oxoacid:acceptor oxidoreductase subunit alpha [Euryarchaeota archaeon]MDE2046616.1 2-oxoacid:acceptor oxidoreductase subunit alpha [Thermoplasmata archaeon]